MYDLYMYHMKRSCALTIIKYYNYTELNSSNIATVWSLLLILLAAVTLKVAA